MLSLLFFTIEVVFKVVFNNSSLVFKDDRNRASNIGLCGSLLTHGGCRPPSTCVGRSLDLWPTRQTC